MKTGPYRRPLSWILLGLLALTMASCGGEAEGEAEGEESISLAITDIQGLEELQREYGHFQEKLEELTGREFEFFPVSDRAAASAALSNERVDLVFTGPAEYVVMAEQTDVTPVVALERPDYQSCIYTHVDTGITDLAELEGEKVAMTDVGSTSGHLGPSQILVDAGMDPLNDLEVVLVGDAVHQALKRGDVAAVGVGCQDIATFTEDEDPDDYPILAEGDPLPPDVFVARPGLSDETIQLVKDAFEDNFEEILDTMRAEQYTERYANAELRLPNDDDYDVVRSMYEAIGVDDYSEFIE